jgi:flagellum-specific peptidoglycan hydrolase FlgJ
LEARRRSEERKLPPIHLRSQVGFTSDHRYAGAVGLLPDTAALVHAVAPVYATDADYADKLMEIIQGDGLERYDAPAVDVESVTV